MEPSEGGDYQKRKKRVVRTRHAQVIKIPWKIGAGCIVFLLTALIGFLVLFPSVTPQDITRISVVVVSDPMHVVSLDRETQELRVLTIPVDVTVDAVHGYGRYSLEALWKLGSIEKKEGAVLAESLEETIGLPVPYYIGRTDHEFIKGSNPEEIMANVFTFQGLFALLRGGFQTNIPAREFLAITRSRSEALSTKHQTTDLSASHVLVKETAADGTSVSVLDTERLDQIVKADYEHTNIRNERQSVSIFNTTDSPALGSRVARLLGHLGVRIVSGVNDTPALDFCRITGVSEALASFKAQVISSLDSCELVPVGESGQSDLDVRIGKAYQKRFIPFEKDVK